MTGFKVKDQVMLKEDESFPAGSAGQIINGGIAPDGLLYWQIYFFMSDPKCRHAYIVKDTDMGRIFTRLKRIPEEMEMHFPKTYLK